MRDLHCHRLAEIINLVDAAVCDAEGPAADGFAVDNPCGVITAVCGKKSAHLQCDPAGKMHAVQQFCQSGDSLLEIPICFVDKVLYGESRPVFKFGGHITGFMRDPADQIIQIRDF